jgi:hypothetical protein
MTRPGIRVARRLLAPLGIQPGRALSNAQPTPQELAAWEDEQLVYIRLRMENDLNDLDGTAPTGWPPPATDAY